MGRGVFICELREVLGCEVTGLLKIDGVVVVVER